MTDTNISLFGVITFYSYISHFSARLGLWLGGGWAKGEGRKGIRELRIFKGGWTFSKVSRSSSFICIISYVSGVINGSLFFCGFLMEFLHITTKEVQVDTYVPIPSKLPNAECSRNKYIRMYGVPNSGGDWAQWSYVYK